MSSIQYGRQSYGMIIGAFISNFISVLIISFFLTLVIDLISLKYIWPKFYPFIFEAWSTTMQSFKQNPFRSIEVFYTTITENIRIHIDYYGLSKLATISLASFLSLFFGMMFLFKSRGKSLFREGYVRGARLIPEDEYTHEVKSVTKKLAKEIKQDTGNSIKIGSLWGKPFAISHNQKIEIPEASLGRTILARGMPGSGKTTLIKHFLERARGCGEKCFIVDPNGEFYSQFGQSGDTILSLYDKRSELWEFQNECHRGKGFNLTKYAEFLVAEGRKGGDEIWWKGPRAVLKFLFENTKSSKELLQFIEGMDKGAMAYIEGIARSAAGQVGSKQEAGIVGGTVLDLQFLEHLNHWPSKNGKTKPFSIYDWSQNMDRNWVFITYADDDKAVSSPLIRIWTNLAILGTLAREESNRNIPLNVVIDELGDVGAIELLPSALRRFRKYQGRLLLGLQTEYQFFDQYPQDRAKDMRALIGNHVVFRVTDPQEAAAASKLLGEMELVRRRSSERLKRDTLTISETEFKKPVVMPEEFSTLGDGHFFLKSLGINPVQSRVKNKRWSKRNPLHKECHAYPPVKQSKKFRSFLEDEPKNNGDENEF